jgi:hypothetical protein
MTVILTAENCFRRIMDRKKGNAGKKRSPNSGTNGNNLKLLLQDRSMDVPCISSNGKVIDVGFGNNCHKNPLNHDSIDYFSEKNVFLA